MSAGGGGVSACVRGSAFSQEEEMEGRRLGATEEEGKWAAVGICNEVSGMLMWFWRN